jgi:hypothetical protein
MSTTTPSHLDRLIWTGISTCRGVFAALIIQYSRLLDLAMRHSHFGPDFKLGSCLPNNFSVESGLSPLLASSGLTPNQFSLKTDHLTLPTAFMVSVTLNQFTRLTLIDPSGDHRFSHCQSRNGLLHSLALQAPIMKQWDLNHVFNDWGKIPPIEQQLNRRRLAFKVRALNFIEASLQILLARLWILSFIMTITDEHLDRAIASSFIVLWLPISFWYGIVQVTVKQTKVWRPSYSRYSDRSPL